MKIDIRQLSEEEIEKRGIRSWPTWSSGVSRFDWFYDSTEECLVLKGRVVVEAGGESVEIKAGDFVTFPKGMSCVWDVKEAIEKHYNFKD